MSSTDIETVLAALGEMYEAGIIENYAIGGAFAQFCIPNRSRPLIWIFSFFSKKNTPGQYSVLKDYTSLQKQRASRLTTNSSTIDGWLVQFVESSENPLWSEAIENADELTIGQLKANVIDREHLVAMWLFAGRPKDYQKIAMFVDADILEYEKLNDILIRHDLLVKWKAEKWRFANEK